MDHSVSIFAACVFVYFAFTEVDIMWTYYKFLFVKLLVRQLPRLPDLFRRPCWYWRLTSHNLAQLISDNHHMIYQEHILLHGSETRPVRL